MTNLVVAGGLLLPMVRDHGDEGDRKEAPLAGPCLKVSLHPVLVLSLLINDYNDVILLECQLVLVVRCAVVQGSASPSASVLQFDEKISQVQKKLSFVSSKSNDY